MQQQFKLLRIEVVALKHRNNFHLGHQIGWLVDGILHSLGNRDGGISNLVQVLRARYLRHLAERLENVEVAILSLWLAEHQMNMKFKASFGRCNPALPLKSSGNVIAKNAVQVDWDEFIAAKAENEVYLLGNPPYLGARNQEPEQKADLALVFEDDEEYKDSDYVCCWFIKAAEFISGKSAKYAFVATNSICQGEQVAYLWPRVFAHNLEIDFAYTSFKWTNFAKNNAGVTCVIVGIRNRQEKPKFLFSQDSYKVVKNINPYLIEGKDVYVRRTSDVLSGFPAMVIGCMDRDGGNLILKPEEPNAIVKE